VSTGKIKIREALAGEYEDLGRLIQRAYPEYARPGDPVWAGYFSMLADVAGRAAFATVLVAVAGGKVVGTATVELDKTIEGTQDLQPGQANFRLLAVDPRGSPVIASRVAWSLMRSGSQAQAMQAAATSAAARTAARHSSIRAREGQGPDGQRGPGSCALSMASYCCIKIENSRSDDRNRTLTWDQTSDLLGVRSRPGRSWACASTWPR
jgi:hypothetical protein